MDQTLLQIMNFVQSRPGTCKAGICRNFGLSEYRLNRAFRNLTREFPDITFVSSHEHGVWFLELDPSRCLGIDWSDGAREGFFQCQKSPKFSDGRCYEHSLIQSSEMIAFGRKLSYCLGPMEPNARNILSLGMTLIEELREVLIRISPLTKFEFESRSSLVRMFNSAYATLKLRERVRNQRSEDFHWNPEFEARHRASSINPFEYSLRKLFAILGIDSDSSKEDTLRAWKRLARIYHPDTSKDDGDEEKMKEINMAKDRIFRIRRWD